MTDLNTLYERLCAGETLSDLAPYTSRALVQMANAAFYTQEPSAQAGALTALTTLDYAEALDPLSTWVSDADPAFQGRLLKLAVDRAVYALLRAIARDADAPVAVCAIQHLHTQANAPSVPAIRPLLSHTDASVRAEAATFLGAFGGPALVPSLRRLLGDRSPTVQEAAQRAIQQLLGDDAPPPPSKRSSAPKASSTGTAPTSDAQSDATAPNALACVTSSPAQLNLSWQPAEPIPLPQSLPTETLALLRLLGQVSADDQPTVLRALNSSDTTELTQLLSAYRAGSDAARGAGLALAAQVYGSPRWVSPLRSLLVDSAPNVRACTLLALAKLAGPSVLPSIGGLLGDVHPTVRQCAATALAHAGQRLSCESLAISYLRSLGDDPDESVNAAIKSALSALNA